MTIKKSINICSLLFLLLFFSCGKKTTTEDNTTFVRPVKTEQLALSTQVQAGNYPAQTSPRSIVDLSFRISGPLEVLLAEEGKKFRKGDLLAQIDSRDFEIDLNEKKAIYEQKKSETERYKRLLEKGSIPLNDFERKDAEYQKARSSYFNSRNALEDTKLYAPFNGTVGQLFVENFQDIRANQSILSFIDLSRIEIEFFVPESQLFQAEDVKEFQITFDAVPERKFTASLKEIGNVAQTQGFPVSLVLNDIVVKNPEYIKQATSVGFTVKVNVIFNDEVKEEKIIVPVSAIFEDELSKETSVWILDRSNMTVNKRTITTGSFVSDKAVEATSGVQAGEYIVTAGKYKIKEGQKVKDIPNKL